MADLGSNALAMAKVVVCPVLLIKQRLDEGEPIKYAVAVDSTSFPAMRFVCSLMRPQDQLVLLRCVPKESEDGLGQTSANQRLITSFKDVALSEGVRANAVLSVGTTLEVLPASCKSLKVNVLVMQLPKLRTFTDTVKKIVVSCPVSVLLFKADQPGHP